MSLVSKEDRIRLRSELYAKGEIDLDQFYSLEKESLEEEELENKESKYEGLSLTELDEIRRAERELKEANEEQESEPVSLVPEEADLRSQPVNSQDPGDLDHILRTISTEELQSLSMYDQNRLYAHNPKKFKEIIKRERSFHDRLNPETDIYYTDPMKQKSFSPDITVEEFNSMSLREQSDLYNSDPDLVKRLIEESRSGRTL